MDYCSDIIEHFDLAEKNTVSALTKMANICIRVALIFGTKAVSRCITAIHGIF